jgi:hypothetical protein
MIFFIVILLCIGAFSVYMLIEFFEYLKKFHIVKWRELSFERPFGIAQEDFYFYPIRPLKFIPFLFSKNDINDKKVSIYKTSLQISLLAITFLFIICSFM